MDWVVAGTLIAACGVATALVAQLGRALARFERQVVRQTELAYTVETLTGAVGELKTDVRELKDVLKNGLNMRLERLDNALRMQEEHCKANVGRINDRLDRIER